MTREEYEERRLTLEEQHRADLDLLNAAHELRLRDLERVWQGRVEGDWDAAAPDSSSLPVQPATVLREPVPAAAVPARKPMRKRYSVVHDLQAALPGLPKVFDRHDILQALGYVPARTTLHRALEVLQQEGMIAVEDHSLGGVTTRYRKLDSARA